MKIITFEMEQWERYAFDQLQKHEIIFENGMVTEENASRYGDAEIISIFIYSLLTIGYSFKIQKAKAGSNS